jgi:hypothetical protein
MILLFWDVMEFLTNLLINKSLELSGSQLESDLNNVIKVYIFFVDQL